MITDETVSEIPAAQADTAGLWSPASGVLRAIAAIAGQHDDLVVTEAHCVIVAGDYGLVIRSLAQSGAITLGDLQLGSALRRGAVDWAVWGAEDTASGRIEGELRDFAGGQVRREEISR